MANHHRYLPPFCVLHRSKDQKQGQERGCAIAIVRGRARGSFRASHSRCPSTPVVLLWRWAHQFAGIDCSAYDGSAYARRLTMGDKNPRRSAGQLRRQVRVQRTRVIAAFVVAFFCGVLAWLTFQRISGPRWAALGFGIYAAFSGVMEARVLRGKRDRLAELEAEATRK